MALSVVQPRKPAGTLTAKNSAPAASLSGVKPTTGSYATYQRTATTPGQVATWGPSQAGPAQTTNPQAPGGTVDTGGGSGYYDPYAAAQAQQEAADAAKRNQLQSGIKNLIGQTLGIYDSLYGDVRNAATSQRRLLDQRYNREVGGLTDQFNAELPKIGRSYAGRGAYDSSYRIDSENQAQQGFENQIEDISEQRQADAAKIGQWKAEQEAQFGAQKSLLQTVQSRLPETEDISELTQLRNDIERRVAELQASRGGTQSREAYLGQVNKLAPAADRMASLQATLSSIVNGQAPGPLKRAVAEQIIGSAGLNKDDELRLISQVNTQIG